MTDLLTTLIQRTRGTAPVAEPMIAPRFATLPAMMSSMIRADVSAVPYEMPTPVVTDQTGTVQSPTPRRDDEALSNITTDRPLRPRSDAPSPAPEQPFGLPAAIETISTEHHPHQPGMRPPTPQQEHLVDTPVAPPRALPPAPQQEHLVDTTSARQAHTSVPPSRRVPPHQPFAEAPSSTGADWLVPPLLNHHDQRPSVRDQDPFAPHPVADEVVDTPVAPPRALPPAPQQEHLVDTTSARQAHTSVPPSRRVPPHQPFAEAPSSTGADWLVPPLLNHHDQRPSVRDQDPFAPHPVADEVVDTPVAPRRIAKQPATEPAPAPTIQVSIGRVEVRAKIPAPTVPHATPERPHPALSLDDYLKRRNGGQL